MVSSVFIVGVGMGNPQTLTIEAKAAIDAADLVIGSARLVGALAPLKARTCVLVGAERIRAALEEASEEHAVVLMSGDVGFHSGATTLIAALAPKEGLTVRSFPGISSVQWLCARLNTPWDDARLVSAHGRDVDVAHIVRTTKKTFLLAGGILDAPEICRRLTQAGLGHVRVHVGERLSLGDERIVSGTARDLKDQAFDPLSSLLVENDTFEEESQHVGHLRDDAFMRGHVPMTKREVRTLVVARLEVAPTDVVWDVGAGTGAVTVELARAAHRGAVFAIDANEEACALIETNCERLDAHNVTVVYGVAPEALVGLPAPDAVFVGGTTGKLEPIVRSVLATNPAARLCVTAVTLETLSEATTLFAALAVSDIDIVQVQVSRATTMGNHTLMRAENPVFIMSARGSGDAR